MGKPKSLGRLPLISRHEFAGVVAAHHIPMFLHEEHVGARGMHGDIVHAVPHIRFRVGQLVSDTRPLVMGFQVFPPSSLRKAPAAEMAMKMRSGLLGSRIIVCRHMPPAPGCHRWPLASRRPGSSCQICPRRGLEEGGIFCAGIDRLRIGQGWLQVPDAHELPGMLRAVVPLVRAGVALVGEFVIHGFPGLSAIVRAMDHLPEPVRGL